MLVASQGGRGFLLAAAPCPAGHMQDRQVMAYQMIVAELLTTKQSEQCLDRKYDR